MSENDNQETIADIVAEMRYGTIPKHRTDHELLALYADRVEAAWKREIAEVEASALDVGGVVEASRHTGNAAAMREALEFADKELRRAIEDSRYGDDVVYLVGCMRSVASVCRAALSAPLRNCDRFGGDYNRLRAAWWDWTASPNGRNPDGTTKMSFTKWLLATATERKGEGDGSK